MNALSFDIEDYFQVQAFARVVRREDWGSFAPRVVENTRKILELLDRHGTHATFFVLGWVAERHPELVQEIVQAGHELASHGYWHRLVYEQERDDFASDLRRAHAALRNACPETPLWGYRSPSFSIVQRSTWALDELAEQGYRYDSSVFPIAGHDTYGMAGAPRFAERIRGQLWEIPPSTLRRMGRNWPVAGGGYFRLYPLWLTRKGIGELNQAGHPAVIYLHPWEFDPQQPRVRGVGWRSRFRHYVNLDKTLPRLDTLLGEFEFGPMCQVFAEQLQQCAS